MTQIKVKEGERFDSVLKRFRKMVEKSGIMQELRKHEHYDKPSVKKKRKMVAAKKRARRSGDS